MRKATSPIRVLVVDDSALMRKLIPQLIAHDPEIEVVATAIDGEFALRKIEELKPDVVTLDLEMPRMDGIEVLRTIMRQQPNPLPIVVVSAHTHEGASLTFKALHMGAFDFIAKPQDVLGDAMDETAHELVAKIKAAAASPAERRRPRPLPQPPMVRAALPDNARAFTPVPPAKVIAIGISTGGPNTLEYVLAHLPADFPGAIVVVQHMPAGFTEAFARRLSEACPLEVREAKSGDQLSAGRVLIAPGNRHMRVRRSLQGGLVTLSDEERVNGHRPSVDVLFESVSQEFGAEAIGVLMTGMGEDGAEGLGRLRRTGAFTIAQDEESCVVFGMPRVAIERGYVSRIVSLESMAAVLAAHCPPNRPLPQGEADNERPAGHV
ncbi:MAG: chemotaxis response regulator protein-glutamate methylesterase [Acidobacteriota bacterium]|nr:chemotaxis response regulator protein-glutamate methylesterase [Acidobacteriota bacterium]